MHTVSIAQDKLSKKALIQRREGARSGERVTTSCAGRPSALRASHMTSSPSSFPSPTATQRLAEYNYSRVGYGLITGACAMHQAKSSRVPNTQEELEMSGSARGFPSV